MVLTKQTRKEEILEYKTCNIVFERAFQFVIRPDVIPRALSLSLSLSGYSKEEAKKREEERSRKSHRRRLGERKKRDVRNDDPRLYWDTAGRGGEGRGTCSRYIQKKKRKADWRTRCPWAVQTDGTLN